MAYAIHMTATDATPCMKKHGGRHTALLYAIEASSVASTRYFLKLEGDMLINIK